VLLKGPKKGGVSCERGTLLDTLAEADVAVESTGFDQQGCLIHSSLPIASSVMAACLLSAGIRCQPHSMVAKVVCFSTVPKPDQRMATGEGIRGSETDLGMDHLGKALD